MKAIRVSSFGEPEVMSLQEIPIPELEPRQILVRLHATGVNPVDTYIRAGKYGVLPELPFTPGIDGAGVVEKSRAANHRPGERVYIAGNITGSYAEYAICEAAQVHSLPDSISFAEGAALGVPYATAYRALFHRAKATAGETVLVHGGTGGVGIAAVQIARAAGMKVYATGGTEAGRKMLLEQGAEVFDHHAPDYIDYLRQSTRGRGVDVILEMLANVNLEKDLTLLANHGRVVIIGSRGRVEIDPRLMMLRETEIRGMVLFNTPAPKLAGIHAALQAGLVNGTLKPVVREQLPLEEAARAHHMVLQPGAFGKIVLTP